jgi:hypothetical protein
LKKQRRIIFLREGGGGGIPIKKMTREKKRDGVSPSSVQFSSLGLVEDDREEQ